MLDAATNSRSVLKLTITFFLRVKVLTAIGLSAYCNYSYGLEAGVGYDTKYVQQGLKQMESGGIVWLSAAHDLAENFSVSAIYGQSTNSSRDYDEFNLDFGYETSVKDFNISLNVTHFQYFEDEESDNELSGRVVLQTGRFFVPTAEFIYGTRSHGRFFQVGVETQSMDLGPLSLSPYLAVGYDDGYIGDIEPGFHHTALGTAIEFDVMKGLGSSIVIEYNKLSSKYENEEDNAWVGWHMTYEW